MKIMAGVSKPFRAFTNMPGGDGRAARFCSTCLAVLLASLYISQPAFANSGASVCRPVGIQCVGVVMKTDGTFWLADRVESSGRYDWQPIKPTHCPNASDPDYAVYTAIDPQYGAYRCIYPGADKSEGSTLTIGTKRQKMGRYVRTHRFLLALDTVLVLSSLADSASSVRCEHTTPFCSEDNPLLPRHPSPAQLYAFKMGATAAAIFLDHFSVHKYRLRSSHRRVVPLAFCVAYTLGMIAGSIQATATNVDFTERFSSVNASPAAVPVSVSKSKP